ncbi:hypothetical protein LTR95_000749 [Oleoguttula sp. CCFEE 5521]
MQIGPNTKPIPRCTFDQFLEYIWTWKVDKNKNPITVGEDGRPIPRPVVNAFGGADMDAAEFVGKKEAVLLRNIREFTGLDGQKLTDASDSKKVVSGATNYYDAIQKCTLAVNTAAEKLESKRTTSQNTDKASKTQIALIKRSRDMAEALVAFRLQDLEKHRLDALNSRLDKLHPGVKVSTVDGERGTLRLVPPFQTFDAAKTIADNRAKVPEIETSIAQVVSDWLNDPRSDMANRNHVTALESAKIAQAQCHCRKNFPQHLDATPSELALGPWRLIDKAPLPKFLPHELGRRHAWQKSTAAQ